VLFGVLPLLVLLLGGGGAGAYFFLFAPADPAASETGEHGDAEADDGEALFFDLPEILVNLNTGSKQASYLKLRVALEFHDPEATEKLEQLMPRIIDNFQVYLRELRREDLNGSAGIYRLKEELLIRVNSAVYPIKVRDVLFKEMLVQ